MPQVVEKTSVPISPATPVAKEMIPVAAPTIHVSMDEMPPKPQQKAVAQKNPQQNMPSLILTIIKMYNNHL